MKHLNKTEVLEERSHIFMHWYFYKLSSKRFSMPDTKLNLVVYFLCLVCFIKKFLYSSNSNVAERVHANFISSYKLINTKSKFRQ